MDRKKMIREEQMDWLRTVRDHVANSFHNDRNDRALSQYDGQGRPGKNKTSNSSVKLSKNHPTARSQK